MMSAAEERALLLLRSPRFMLPRATIQTRAGQVNSLLKVGMLVEQMELIDALAESRFVCVVKARKVGVTTIGVLYFTHRLLFHPHAYNVMGIGHDTEACLTMIEILDTFQKGLREDPSPGIPSGLGLRFIQPCRPWNAKRASFQFHGYKRSYMSLLAGGRGSGRSKTVRGLHFTECAFYPRGSSASGVSGDSEEGADEQVVQSALSSAVDDEHLRVLFESTANGPTGYFYKQVRKAQFPPPGAEPMRLLFFPWFKSTQYRAQPVPGFERTDEEERLAVELGLDDWQLQWKRNKFAQNYTVERFRKEYPATLEDPFLVGGGMWFDIDLLNRLLPGCDPNQPAVGWRIYEEPRPNRVYFIGADPSGGVGRDDAVACILRDDGRQVATFSSSTCPPYTFAGEISDASTLYNGARVLCEDNNHGRAVNERLRSLGVTLYVTPQGKVLWVDPSLKLAMSAFLRDQINRFWVVPTCPYTISQLMHVREQPDGNVAGDPGTKDDHFSALSMAAWNLRPYARSLENIPLPVMSSRIGEQKVQIETSRLDRIIKRLNGEG